MKLSVDEVRLLREVIVWARANGYRSDPVRNDGDEVIGRDWQRLDGIDGHEVTVLFESACDGFRVAALTAGEDLSFELLPTTVRQSVDFLATAGILPLKFSSAFQAGRESAYIRDEWRVFAEVVNSDFAEDYHFPYVYATADERAEAEDDLARARIHYPQAQLEHRRTGATDWSRVDD